MTPLTESVCEKIDALFPPETREAAQKLIAEKCGADLPLSNHMGPDASGFDRIRFAVLKVSRGDLAALEREIAAAQIDWRDTLMAAGFGQESTLISIGRQNRWREPVSTYLVIQ